MPILGPSRWNGLKTCAGGGSLKVISYALVAAVPFGRPIEAPNASQHADG
jgi:hypothetical protein